MRSLTIVLIFLLVLFCQCNKNKTDPPVYEPVVTTLAATNITSTSVTLGGVINSPGSSAVIERGVYWSTNPNPTPQNGGVAYMAGDGSPFTFNITSLSPATTYYVRAYAKNNIRTGLGNVIVYTTP